MSKTKTPKKKYADIGKRIKSRMKKLGYTQSDISSTVGASSGAVSLWVNGGSKPQERFLNRIATLLETEPSWILTGSVIEDDSANKNTNPTNEDAEKDALNPVTKISGDNDNSSDNAEEVDSKTEVVEAESADEISTDNTLVESEEKTPAQAEDTTDEEDLPVNTDAANDTLSVIENEEANQAGVDSADDANTDIDTDAEADAVETTEFDIMGGQAHDGVAVGWTDSQATPATKSKKVSKAEKAAKKAKKAAKKAKKLEKKARRAAEKSKAELVTAVQSGGSDDKPLTITITIN